MEDHQYSECSAYTYNEESNRDDDIPIERKDGDAFLIELYRERPFLYNKEHRDFKNKIIKDNAWNEISTIMQNENYGNFYTSEFCQTRCTSLRTQYNREKRILSNQYKSGSAASNHKPFVFNNQLSFLDNYVKRRRTHSNIKANAETLKAPSSTSSPPSSTIPKFNLNEVFDINEESSDQVIEKENNNFNDEENKENILENTLPRNYLQNTVQATHKRTIEKDSNISFLKPVKKSKVNETKEIDNMFASISQKIISVLDDKHESNEDKAFANFIITHLANLSQSEKNIRKKMITDALFSSIQNV